MKNYILLLSVLLFALTACDKKSTTEDAPNSEQTSDTAQAPVKEEAPQDSTDEKKEQAATGDGTEKKLITPDQATLTAPDKFKVKFITTKGDFVVDVDKSLSPKGADRFYNLAKLGFYDDVAFFRVIKGFMAQFGMNGDPEVTKAWAEATIDDDPTKATNTRGAVTFAKTGAPNSRTTQLFINFGDNSNLDSMGFAPFGKVDEEGMKVVDQLYNGYGEGAPRGNGPSQDQIRTKGNTYLKADFPKLDYIKSTEVIEE